MCCKFTWDSWVATWGADHPKHAKPTVTEMAYRYNSPLLQAPKQKSLQYSISSWQLLAGRNNHQLPLCYTVPASLHMEDTELGPFGGWPFSCWLFDVIYGTSHTFQPKGNNCSPGAPTELSFSDWYSPSPIHKQKMRVRKTLWCFWWCFGNFPSYWVMWIKFISKMQLTEGKNLEGF